MAEIINPDKLAYELNTLEMLQLEYSVSKIKNLPKEIMDTYYTKKEDMLKEQILKIKRRK